MGNHIIVLSINKCQNKPNDMSISLKKVTCQAASSTRTNNSSPLHGRFGYLSLLLILIFYLYICEVNFKFINYYYY